jgi:hypothetical protein
MDWFLNFHLWTTTHYFAFKNRKRYPNMFFFYFSQDGRIDPILTKKDINLFINYTRAEKRHLSGMWGYLSLKFNEKSGLSLYKYILSTEYMRPEYNFPLYQDALPYSAEISVNIKFK